MSVPEWCGVNQTSFDKFRQSEKTRGTGQGLDSPFLWEICGGVLGFEVDPDACGQVQPVQVGAVEITRRSSKHVQVAVDNDHGLAMEAE